MNHDDSSAFGDVTKSPVDGDTVNDVLEAMFEVYPDLRHELFHAGMLRENVSICLNGQDTRELADGLNTHVRAGDNVSTRERPTRQ
ncbi:ThiS family protein [Luteibacter rhizovicinus]|uniref:ThiS family protein n=1 Tax=Luteibacter rhizovicinus TaxID=242606 RepID=A0A4R3YY99_9GAMM|nr:MoaD/ThiS family protein [Luteibacter rhizovicinus]TCV97532.1 ThiS family protein [Luteibacter rhizovicinus]